MAPRPMHSVVTGRREGGAVGDVLWTPPADVRERSRIGDYLRWLREHRGLDFADYDELWRWSVTDLDAFWRSIWDHFEVVAHTPPTATLADRGDARRPLVPRRHAQLRRERAADARPRPTTTRW